MFILPEDLERLKKNKNTPDVEEAIRNVEMLQRQIVEIDNDFDFVQIETESMLESMKEPNFDGMIRLLPTYVKDVKKLINKLRGIK